MAIELALASIPGFYGLGGPAPASPYGVFWPTTVPADLCPQTVRVGDRVTVVDATISDADGRLLARASTTFSVDLEGHTLPDGAPVAGFTALD